LNAVFLTIIIIFARFAILGRISGDGPNLVRP
jgi:hypothetical protein